MSAVLYDEAFLKKLKSWTEKTKINIYGPSEASRVFQIEADMNKDKSIKLPMIVLNRQGYSLNYSTRNVNTYDGKRIYIDEQKVKQINALPITLRYTLDVYARYYEEADAYIRELIFNIVNYPKIEIVLPYMDFNYKHYSNIRLEDQITDDSDSVRIFKDQITKLSLDINIDDAYIWDTRIKSTISIGDGLTVSTISESKKTVDTETVTID